MATHAATADAIVVAAGSSSRMGGVDKLAAAIHGRPLLAWTLDALAGAASVRGLIVVAAPERADALAGEPWLQAHGARVVAGGGRRQESVAAGVEVSTAALVLVHDGARPLVTSRLVDAVVAAAAEHGAAIPVVPIAETIKRVGDGRVVGTVARDGLATAQTPQGARRELLLRAYAANDPRGAATFTDEAAILEAAGTPVATVPGDVANIKVTQPADLSRVADLLGSPAMSRVGIGRDGHPFGPADGLALGGITIAEAPRLHGHSDGDAALHAVADALLGATGLGDLGRLFPASDSATEGIDSRELLRDVTRRVGASGWRPSHLDLTVVGARPRLGAARLDEMRDAIAGLLELDRQDVSVKASTGNLDGADGAGRSISAVAIVTVVAR
jgi:2-C-methyl-D-erythritol 4-phosphate cytidylyltransferase/2-C-methyl-D-erythritol 2,4-cyclodiphosphate synthase